MALLARLPLSNASVSFSSSLSPSPSLPTQSRSSFRAKSLRRRRPILTVQAKIREIFMPALSSTMTEGKIVSWIKAEGDRLSKGESVVVVESDKADMDVETFYDGILAAIVVPEGESAPVGAPIGLLAESEEEITEARAKAASKSSSSAPKLATSPPETATSSPAPAIPQPPPVKPVSAGPRKIVATPFAKKLAKQHKVDIESVVGSGPFGRITPADVEAAAGITPSKSSTGGGANAGMNIAAEPAAPKPAAPTAAPPPIPGSTVVPFTTMQAAVSKNMLESLTVPTFRVGYPVTTNALDALYEKVHFGSQSFFGFKLMYLVLSKGLCVHFQVKPKGVTMTALLAKAAAMALVQHPVVNATCKDGKSFTYNANINIAVAVAIDGGLITPVLQDADKVV